MKKKKYFNRIVLVNGSTVFINSSKYKKITELMLDNYNSNFISTLNQEQKFNLSKQTKLYKLIKKFEKK